MGDEAPRKVVAAACLGRLGRWGNQVLQYAACKLAAELHGCQLLCPDWAGRRVLAGAAEDGWLSDEVEAHLPLCADRPVLSHAGWLAWARTREPLLSAYDGAAISGRQVRRLLPQVNASVLDASATAPAALERAHAWWGWFQFHTSAFAAHRLRFRSLFTLTPGCALALSRALEAARGGDVRPIWGLHVRLGEGFVDLHAAPAEESGSVPPPPSADEPRAEWTPPTQGGLEASCCSTTGVWKDTGVFWSAPAEWYSRWLCTALAAWKGPKPVLVLCSDVPKQAARALRPLGVRTLAEVLGAHGHDGLVAAFGGGENGAALADWHFLSACDALAISNSTFSFTAAMLADAGDADAQPFCAVRPDPNAGALVAFNAWDAQPTLKRT